MTGRSSSGNSCGRVSAWYSVRTKPGASMGRPSSTMPPKPSSTAPVWARSSPQACSTTFSPGRIPPDWHHNSTSRNIPTPPNGRNSTRTTVPTTRTAPPRTWRPPSISLPPYPAERPATSPYRRSAKRKRDASTAGSNKEQKDSINQATIRMAYRPHFRSVKRTTGV